MTEATLFLPGLSPVGGKTITATFDGGKLSSNGGVLILREIERKLGLAAVLSRHIPDDRDCTRVTHSYSDMTRRPVASEPAKSLNRGGFHQARFIKRLVIFFPLWS